VPTGLRMNHPRLVRRGAGQPADGADGRSGTQACRPPAAQSAAPFGGHDGEQIVRNAMRHTHTKVDTGLIWISVVLLVGILLVAAGHFTGNRLAFYAGTLVTLAGVFTGIQRLFLHARSKQRQR
jgi:hypothetical protein